MRKLRQNFFFLNWQNFIKDGPQSWLCLSQERGGRNMLWGGRESVRPPSQLRHYVKCKRIERYIFLYKKNRNSVGRAVCVADYKAECDVIWGLYLSILGDDIFCTFERIESNQPYYTIYNLGTGSTMCLTLTFSFTDQITL